MGGLETAGDKGLRKSVPGNSEGKHRHAACAQSGSLLTSVYNTLLFLPGCTLHFFARGPGGDGPGRPSHLGGQSLTKTKEESYSFLQASFSERNDTGAVVCRRSSRRSPRWSRRSSQRPPRGAVCGAKRTGAVVCRLSSQRSPGWPRPGPRSDFLRKTFQKRTRARRSAGGSFEGVNLAP